MDKKQEIEALRERVKEGNQKLNEAWTAICLLDHKEQRWSDEVEKWHQANEKLSNLCSQLIGLGFEDCLYIIDGADIASKSQEEVQEILKKIDKGEYYRISDKVKTKPCLGDGLGCRVCPSRMPYWEKEIMNLPSAGK